MPLGGDTHDSTVKTSVPCQFSGQRTLLEINHSPFSPTPRPANIEPSVGTPDAWARWTAELTEMKRRQYDLGERT